MAFVLPALHSIQACLGAYGLYLSYISITDLQRYEEKSEKAAKYSTTAEHQLHKTRTTQVSGALTITTSLAASLTLAYLSTSSPTLLKFAINPALAAGALFARAHISNFWRGKAKVPFVGGFNEAISRTGELQTLLAWLAGSWAVTGAVWAWSLS
ncbi:hypothetical protein BJ546DRAFT_951390 [Cryomyces antarcticus]|nr:hypothetical protein LTR60_004119 [Cryomyces antarcticus]KAK5149079.1 hypothetical protein LTR04_000112 [Oleoguttula sp. CCFEE 6159]